MGKGSPTKARLLANIPSERMDETVGDGSQSNVGDIVELDQGFTGPNGEPMGMVVCYNADRSIRWAGDVLDSEIEVIR
jgi:hypothetical protein